MNAENPERMFSVLAAVTCAFVAESKHCAYFGGFSFKLGYDFVRICLSRHIKAFRFVQEHIINKGSVDRFQCLIHRGRVENDLHLLCLCFFHYEVYVVYLILKDDEITFRKLGEDGIDIFFRHAPVCAAVNYNTVFPARVYLYNSMTGRCVDLFYKMNVNACRRKCVREHVAVTAYATCVIDICARLCKGNRLIESLSAAEGLALDGTYCFSGSHEMIGTVNIVAIKRTETEYFQIDSLLTAVFFRGKRRLFSAPFPLWRLCQSRIWKRKAYR